ncbi:MAG: glycosyltransferase family 4 protein [Lachnospiraceae bacterium]|nr:glycosyltransferase family 4 protein [Lachnospiraceae bacterium]
MKKLLYLTVWDFSDAESNGICKKILSQVNTLKKMGFEVDFAYTKNGEVYLKQKEENILLGQVPKVLNIILAHRIFAAHLKKERYDAVYVRHCVISPYYIHLLSILRKNSNKIVVEFPTYPYDKELSKGIKLRLGYCMDCLCRNRMKRYVDRIITYSEHDEIFGIPTIKTINGVDFDSIPQVKHARKKSEINLIGVAMLSPWHGFDRVIMGLKNYYENKPDIVVNFLIVGSGGEYEKYVNMVDEYGLKQYVKFFGNQSGKELDHIYDQADLAVSSLAFHRIGLNNGSSLKSREYGARGLPILSTIPIDYLPEDCSYVCIVPIGESAIDIQKIVDFMQKIEENEDMDEISNNIRKLTQNVADMPVTFKPIRDYLIEEG